MGVHTSGVLLLNFGQPGDGSGRSGFWRTLANVSEPVTVSLLFQQTEIHYEERHVVGGVLTELALLSETRTDYDFLGPRHCPSLCERETGVS